MTTPSDAGLRLLARMHLMFGGELHRGPRPGDAEPQLRAALALDPSLHLARGLLGKVLLATDRTEAALGALADAARAQPDNVLAQGAYGSALLLAGRYAEGFPIWSAERATMKLPLPRERDWDGVADLRGRTLLVLCHDGFGDALQFCRYVPLLAERGARVVLACQAPLMALMKSLAGVAQVVDRDGPMPPFDLWTDEKVLPVRFGTTLNTIPLADGYLAPPAMRVAAWRSRLPPANGRRRIGLLWAGGTRNDQNDIRSLPPGRVAALLAPVLAVPGVQWFSFQREAPRAELATMPGVIDLTPGLRDFADTAAAMACMDLMIGVETAVTHLAGAMGHPAWIMLAHRPDWRWGMRGERSPWYASARLFRQPITDDWAAVTGSVAGALASAPQKRRGMSA